VRAARGSGVKRQHTITMTTPKRHHFVPAAYLQGFVEDQTGFLNVFSKRTRTWRRQKPNQVMVRNKFYHQDWAPAGVDKDILEKALGAEIEPNGLLALKRLVEEPETLDDTAMAAILEYLQFQRIRVPRQADMAKRLAELVVTGELSKTPEGRQALKSGKVEMKDSFRFDFMRTVHGSLTPYFSRMVWEVIEAHPGTSFVTSDSPVSFYNRDFPPPTEAGAALYGTSVVFPINKRFLLRMVHPEYETGEKGASDALPTDLENEDSVVEIQKGMVWGEDAVHAQNGVMFQLSQDLLVGESKTSLERAFTNCRAAQAQ